VADVAGSAVEQDLLFELEQRGSLYQETGNCDVDCRNARVSRDWTSAFPFREPPTQQTI